nr:hydroxyethylthiazole kinase [uncultured Holophaga sp.]
MSDPLNTWATLQALRAKSPVVHNITNYVVMNNTANALLALGASPVMAHAPEEMAEMVSISSALVLNIGTLSKEWIRAMFLAAEAARKKGIPIVLDPVGAGATSYRTSTARELLKEARPAILRGNASEIMATCGELAQTKGVDSTESSHAALAAAATLRDTYGCAVCISGETDYIVGKDCSWRVHNGHALMPRVTGLGCTATALCGAFAAITPDPALAAAQAMAVMGIAGEMAAEKADGPGTLQLHFLDALYQLDEPDLARRIKVDA